MQTAKTAPFLPARHTVEQGEVAFLAEEKKEEEKSAQAPNKPACSRAAQPVGNVGVRLGHHHRHSETGKIGNGYSEDAVLLVTALASTLARGKTECELETLINLADIFQDALIAILAQRRICDRRRIEIIRGGDDLLI